MRKLIVVAGVLLAFSAGWCFGEAQTATHAPGGGEWKILSTAERDFYTRGFEEGYLQGMIHGGALAVAKLAPESPATQHEDYGWTLGLARKVAPVLTNHPPLQSLETKTSVFYGDNQNIGVCWDDALLLSASPSAPTDQELAAARKRGAESGCK